MNPSTEIKEAMLRAYAAYTSTDASDVLRSFSRQEGVLAIGTDPDEWWSGFESIARVHEAQLPEMGGQVHITAGDIQAYSEGTVGWAADRAVLHVLGQEIPVRLTTVFHREEDEWKIVQHHVSIGALNAEVLGKELTTQ